MKPSDKSPEMNAVLEYTSMRIFGRSRLQSILDDVCLSCKHPANEFRDEVSRKEFSITGMCQKCQDSVFRAGGDGDDD